MSERIAIVHVGTHKTGTTSLQFFCEGNRERLQSAGIYITQAGRYGNLPGNHQVAWELLSSNASPHFDALVTELRSRTERTAVISSEDLSLLYARPEALELLRDGIEAAGFSPTIVLYLRAQAPYAQSMYVERIKHDYIRPLGGYLDAILRDGLYVPDGSPIHMEFEYSRLLEPFVRAFGKDRVIVHPYASSGDSVHIYRDFIAIMASLDRHAFETQLGLVIPRARENQSLLFYDLLDHAHRASNALQTTGSTLPEAIARHAPEVTETLLASPARLLQRGEVKAFCERFAYDNAQLESEFGLAIPGTRREDIAAADDPEWEQARVHREIFDRLLDRWL